MYHHGQVIKEYRELRKMSQAQLAEKWPKSDGEEGVNIRYVQDVEYGKKRIADPTILRKLSELLDIPLWKFGLSEYDPFNPTSLPGRGERMYSETLDVAEVLIKQTLAMRRTAPLPEVQKSAHGLDKLFHYFMAYMPPTSQLEPRFLSLYAQELNIKGLMYFENKQYSQALETFTEMYRIAERLGDPVLTVHALQKMGVELNRANRKQEAVQALEDARDLSFHAGKHVAAFANAYLAHIYAAADDALHFERAINTAIQIAEPVKESYGDGTDFVFHKFSGILQLRSRGYLRINNPQKTLDFHEELKRQINLDANIWLDFRLHLYRARAYLMLGEIEDCIEAGREFFRDVRDWQSPHRTARGYELLAEIEASGYGDLKIVQEFRNDLLTAQQRQEEIR